MMCKENVKSIFKQFCLIVILDIVKYKLHEYYYIKINILCVFIYDEKLPKRTYNCLNLGGFTY